MNPQLLRSFPARCTVAILLFSSAVVSAQPPIHIGSRLELLVDRHLVERMNQVDFRLHSPVKTPRPKSPLPERHMVTVVKDGDCYRAWYRGKDPSYTGDAHTGNLGETVHYAESRDGHEWEFPNLRLHEIGGTRENNVILAKLPPFLTNFMPFLDTRPGVEPAERYKALAGYPGPGDKRGLDKPGHGLFAFVSPDGIRWTKKNEAIRYPPQWRHAFDSPNVAFWSEAEQRRNSRVELWQVQSGFSDGILYPEFDGRLNYICAVTEAGSSVFDRDLAKFAENLKRLPNVQADAVKKFISIGPELRLSASADKKATAGRIQNGIGFRLCIPYRAPELLDVAVNGHSLAESATDGYQAWPADGYTQVQINIPPEKTRNADIFVVTCAYRGNEQRNYGFTPPEAVLRQLQGKQ